MADPGAFLSHALADLERNWPGIALAFAPFAAGTLREQLRDDDRVDFLVPVVTPPNGRFGRGRPTVVATFDDRAVVGWAEGFLSKWRSAVLPYKTIREIKKFTWHVGGADRLGLVAWTEDNQEWRWLFMSETSQNADFEQLRMRLWNRLDGTWIPLWRGDQVTRWIKPDTAGTRATEPEAGTGRRYDATDMLEQLEAHERICAATCGALGCQDPTQISFESGTLFLTTTRLLFVSPTEDRPLADVSSIDRAAPREVRGEGGLDKQAEVIDIAFNDGSSWELASTTRTSAESEHFCSTVSQALAGTLPMPAPAPRPPQERDNI